jgi:muramoyltetrapeptide carboxypeptidase LdcA involved in peptidoglycan recycling
VQRDSGLVATWVRFEQDARATEWKHVGHGRWEVEGGGPLDVTGRLIGGCAETVANLAGTPYGDVRAWAEDLDEPTIVYVEACEENAVNICRYLHSLRLAGWFDRAAAVLVGRTSAPDHEDLTQREAVLDALGRLDVPIVWDLEIGHVPPHLPLINGALARVVVDGDTRELTQSIT